MKGRRPDTLLSVLLGGVFLGNVDTAVTNTATPAIAGDLSASGGELAMIVSGYVLAYAMLLIPGARLGESRGYRRIFLVGLSVFVLTSLLGGLAGNGTTLILARVVQGAGGALMIAQVLTGIQLHYSGRARAHALGWYAAVLAGSAVVGQSAGGLLISANLFGMTWRPVFLVNIPLGAALFVLAVRALPADVSVAERRRIDVAGVAALSVALLLLIVPLVLGRDENWPSWAWLSLPSSMVFLAVFLFVERRAIQAKSQPLIDLRLFRRGPVSWPLTSGALSTATYFAVLFVVALYLQQGLGRSPAFSGAALIPWVAAFGATGPILGRAGTRVKLIAAPVGGVVLAVAFWGITVGLLLGSTNTGLLIVLLGVGGLGYGAVFSGTLEGLTNVVTDEHAPDISGLFNTAIKLGGVLGVAVFGAVYLGLAPHGGQRAAVDAFTVTTAALGGTALLVAGSAYLAMRGIDRRPDDGVGRLTQHLPAKAVLSLPDHELPGQ